MGETLFILERGVYMGNDSSWVLQAKVTGDPDEREKGIEIIKAALPGEKIRWLDDEEEFETGPVVTEVRDTDDVVEGYRKGKLPPEIRKQLERRRPKRRSGLPDIITDSWQVDTADVMAVWRLMEKYTSASMQVVARNALGGAGTNEAGSRGKVGLALTKEATPVIDALDRFKEIARHYTEGMLTASELREIEKHFHVERVLQTANDERGNTVYIPLHKITANGDDAYSELLKSLYYKFDQLLVHDIKLRICAASDCRKLFIPDPKNISRQKYHSSTCRARIGKRLERTRKRQTG